MAELVPADEVRNHWWWRPGWRPGRRFYTWHLTFEDQPDLHTLVDAYQRSLADQPGLDLVPPRWLHLTMQGVGFTDEVPQQELDDIRAAVHARLLDVPGSTITLHRPIVISEAIVLPPRPREPVDALRVAIRAGIADVRGPERVPDPPDTFRPHVSLGYCNTAAAAAPLTAAMAGTDLSPASVAVRTVSLIILSRDEHLYRWEILASEDLVPNDESS